MEPLSFMRRLGLMLGLVLLQVLILNRIALFGYVTPLFYIWMIVRFDSSMSRNSVLLWAFFTGLLVDLFGGTPGLNAASATFLAMLQPGMVKVFVPLDRHEIFVPGSSTMGNRAFWGYLLLTTALHHTVYFILLSIPLGDWSVLALKVVFSTLLTVVFMYAADYSAVKKGPKSVMVR